MHSLTSAHSSVALARNSYLSRRCYPFLFSPRRNFHSVADMKKERKSSSIHMLQETEVSAKPSIQNESFYLKESLIIRILPPTHSGLFIDYVIQIGGRGREPKR